MANILITGASGGIGRALIEALAHPENRLFLHYRRDNPEFFSYIQSLREAGMHIYLGQGNFESSESIQDLLVKMGKDFPFFDSVIHNAGRSQSGLLQDLDLPEWNRLLQVNLTGVFQITKELLPVMIQRQKGSIVTISSVWGICGAACEVAYSASKAALVGFSKALAAEVGPSGIRVNCVAPGLIDTAMNEDLSFDDKKEFLKAVPLNRMGRPSEVASVVKFLISENASYITGQVIDVNGGFLR